VKLLHGLRAKVNAIPLNEHPASSYRRPSPDRVERFASTLARSGVTVSVRRSRGDDILAACGQLGAVPAAPAGGGATVSDGSLR
jgi:23S rRNA (adenine2503-C2)-methyltransferase